MGHRLARVVVGLVLVVSPALVASTASAAAATRAGGWDVAAPGRFSPNGDEVKDTLGIRYRLPVSAHVRVTISPASDSRRPVRRVDLGDQSAGSHTWTWNGRNQSGKRVTDQAYVIRLYDVDPTTWQRARAMERVQVDTAFRAGLAAPTFGAEPGAPARVYPRTTVVTDTLDLRASAEEKKLTSLELIIRNRTGRVVRRADVAEPLTTTNGSIYGYGRTVPWGAVRGGKPLPSGRYTAVVVGSDQAGNTGRSRTVKIWVSDDELEWHETTTTVSPAASTVGQCEYSTGNGCGDVPRYCGSVVPSTMYAGGLSYRSAECATPGSDSSQSASVGASHMLEVPEATGVRGLAAVRVSFTGAPTTAGEADTGTLFVHARSASSVVVGTSGQSAWVEDPSWGAGLAGDGELPQRDPAAVWSFVTKGTDSVDVATYTVDVRYLAPAQ